MGPYESFLVIVIAVLMPWVVARLYAKAARRWAERKANR